MKIRMCENLIYSVTPSKLVLILMSQFKAKFVFSVPRAATIQASVDGTLWALDRQTFRRIVLRNAFQKRKMYEALIENVPLLSALSVSF